MRIVVGELHGTDNSTNPASLTLPTRTPLPPHQRVRKVALAEEESITLPGVGPTEAILGLVGTNIYGNPAPIPKLWMDAPTETPMVGDTEIWEVWNFTVDAHPIHIHEVAFEVVDRENRLSGVVRPPEAWETGYKDTAICYPGEITRLKARFEHPGLYVWHCHIVEHEDNEMMRPYRILHRVNIPFVTNP